MSYKVLKAQPGTLNKAKIAIAWVEQVIKRSSSSSPTVSVLVKKTVETALVFEPRNKNAVLCRKPQEDLVFTEE